MLASMCSDCEHSGEAWRRSNSSEASVTAGRINWRKLKVGHKTCGIIPINPTTNKRIYFNVKKCTLIHLFRIDWFLCIFKWFLFGEIILLFKLVNPRRT